MISRRNFLCALMMGIAVSPALAEPAARRQFEQFLKNAVSASGRFTQTVTDRTGRQAALPSSGRFRFLRPGCFEWVYEKPYEQQIVSDGKTLWLYDPDLMQVTVKKLDANLPATPAAILFGQDSLDERWKFRKVSASEIEMIPPASEGGFEKAVIAMTGQGKIKELTLIDNFGQTARLEFSDWVETPVDRSVFSFKIPEGADVLSDESGA